MGPEEIITRIDSADHGCESCQWYGWKSNATGGKRTCDASQSAFPNGSRAVCVQWYKPKAKKGNGRGRAVYRGGVR